MKKQKSLVSLPNVFLTICLFFCMAIIIGTFSIYLTEPLDELDVIKIIKILIFSIFVSTLILLVVWIISKRQ